jgi:hypothetical protein
MTERHVAVLVRAPADAVRPLVMSELPDASVDAIDAERCMVRSASLFALSDSELALIVRARSLPVAGWKRHG